MAVCVVSYYCLVNQTYFRKSNFQNICVWWIVQFQPTENHVWDVIWGGRSVICVSMINLNAIRILRQTFRRQDNIIVWPTAVCVDVNMYVYKSYIIPSTNYRFYVNNRYKITTVFEKIKILKKIYAQVNIFC